MFTPKMLIVICSVLNHYNDVNGQRGRDVAAEIFGLHEQGRIDEAQASYEKLPDDVRKMIEAANKQHSDKKTPTATVDDLRQLALTH